MSQILGREVIMRALRLDIPFGLYCGFAMKI